MTSITANHRDYLAAPLAPDNNETTQPQQGPYPPRPPARKPSEARRASGAATSSDRTGRTLHEASIKTPEDHKITKRQAPTTPPPPLLTDPRALQDPAFAALSQGATRKNGIDYEYLSTLAQKPGALAGRCAGLSAYALERISSGTASDLIGATGNMAALFANRQTRDGALHMSQYLQETQRTRSAPAGYVRMPGHNDLNAEQLTASLGEGFGSPVLGFENGSLTREQVDFAELSLQYEHGDGHTLLVQRMHQTDDYSTDHYQLYDPNYGAFEYNSFNDMAGALSRYCRDGYGPHDRFTWADTSFLLNNAARRISAVPSASFADTLPDIEAQYGATGGRPLVPAQPGLPPEPDFNPLPPAGSIWMGQHTDLRRSPSSDANLDLQPHALYRPSAISPAQLKKSGGFDTGDIGLREVNLDVHNFDVANGQLDRGGYLATFRDLDTALGHTRRGSESQYIYDIAPSPNMVDVNASLGSHARSEKDREVAAMRRIDWTQIRGYREVKDGKAGPYVPNAAYRWDVYDRTSMARAQAQLANFPVGSPAWSDDTHRPFATAYPFENKQVYGPKQDPAQSNAEFYHRALSKIHDLTDRQAQGLDYRGPLKLRSEASGTNTRLYAYTPDGYIYSGIASSYGEAAKDSFAIGDDGRFHLASDASKVLRIDSKGYAYLSSIPSDPNNTNGVFERVGVYLKHKEDGKYLTDGGMDKTAYVSAIPQDQYSNWDVLDSRGQRASLPVTNLYTYTDSNVANRTQLYEFEQDPDVALPQGATNFITHLPGAPAVDMSSVLRDHLTQSAPRDASGSSGASAGSIAKALSQNNAAWLFRDGYYATAISPDRLEIRKLDGTPVWSADIDPKTGHATYSTVNPTSPASADKGYFRVSDSVWKRLSDEQDKIEQLRHKHEPRR